MIQLIEKIKRVLASVISIASVIVALYGIVTFSLDTIILSVILFFVGGAGTMMILDSFAQLYREDMWS